MKGWGRKPDAPFQVLEARVVADAVEDGIGAEIDQVGGAVLESLVENLKSSFVVAELDVNAGRIRRIGARLLRTGFVLLHDFLQHAAITAGSEGAANGRGARRVAVESSGVFGLSQRRVVRLPLHVVLRQAEAEGNELRRHLKRLLVLFERLVVAARHKVGPAEEIGRASCRERV